MGAPGGGYESGRRTVPIGHVPTASAQFSLTDFDQEYTSFQRNERHHSYGSSRSKGSMTLDEIKRSKEQEYNMRYGTTNVGRGGVGTSPLTSLPEVNEADQSKIRRSPSPDPLSRP